MDFHLTAEELNRYAAHSMTAGEILRVQDHAGACTDCRRRLSQTAQTGDVAVLQAFFDPEPEEQDLVAYVAGHLPRPRAEEIEHHLLSCEACVAAVQDLRDFRQELTPTRRPSALPWWLAAAAVVLLSAGGTLYMLRGRSAEPVRQAQAPVQKSAPQLIASLRDGSGSIALTASGEVTGISGLSAEEQNWLRDTLRDGRLPQSTVAIPGAREGVLRGAQSAASFHVLWPLDARVLSARPIFRWEALKGDVKYEVTVFSEADEQVLAASGEITQASWQPTKALPRGPKLAWQVTAIREGERITAPAPPKPTAIFQIVPAATAQRIEQARAAENPSHLLIAALCAREGLHQEAQLELEALAKLNPGAPLVQSLLANR